MRISEQVASTEEPVEVVLPAKELRERLDQVPSVADVSSDSESVRQRGRRVLESLSKRVGIRQLMSLILQRKRVRSSLDAVPARMQLVTNQAKLVLELVEDFVDGRYRKLPWHSLVFASGALLYTVSPADVLPDFLPLVGALDDMAVLSLAMRWLQKDLKAYCEFKGYDPAQYFEMNAS